jgi:hypothetical protein
LLPRTSAAVASPQDARRKSAVRYELYKQSEKEKAMQQEEHRLCYDAAEWQNQTQPKSSA